jgi:formylglycine-generating enzyme required for sulfatase activity
MLALKSKLGMIAGVLAVSSGVASASTLMSLEPVETVDVAPRVFVYRLAGDFSQGGQTVDAPLVTVARTSALHIMKQQVTVAEYDRCVAETKCMARSPLEGFDPNLPAVQVSWQDATAFAHWLSAKTGETWRLPTDEEWRDRVSMTTLYRLPPRATPPCAGSLVMRRNQDKKHWMSGHALPEPSAQMNTDCSICRGMSGNGPTAALFGNRLMQAASLLVLRRPIVGCESSKANTAPTCRTSFGTRKGAAALWASLRAIWDSVWFAMTTTLQQSLLCSDD